jgi:hypothetical protein
MKRQIKGYVTITRDELIQEILQTIREDEGITYFKVQRDLMVGNQKVGFGILEANREGSK